MTTIEIQVFGLVAMRALAEFDPVEYRRATDVSRLALDQRIRQLNDVHQNFEAFIYYARMMGIINAGTNEVSNDFLLRQIYASCIAIAQFNAVLAGKNGDLQYANIDLAEEQSSKENVREFTSGGERLHVSVMKILQVLRHYNPVFNNSLMNRRFDCVLEPILPDYPFIIVETKKISGKVRSINTDIKILGDGLRWLNQNALGIIIVPPHPRYADVEASGNIFVLQFNLSKNTFVGGGLSRLLAWFKTNELS